MSDIIDKMKGAFSHDLDKDGKKEDLLTEVKNAAGNIDFSKFNKEELSDLVKNKLDLIPGADKISEYSTEQFEKLKELNPEKVPFIKEIQKFFKK